MGLIWVSPTQHSNKGCQHLIISSGLFPWFHAFLLAWAQPPLSALKSVMIVQVQGPRTVPEVGGVNFTVFAHWFLEYHWWVSDWCLRTKQWKPQNLSSKAGQLCLHEWWHFICRQPRAFQMWDALSNGQESDLWYTPDSSSSRYVDHTPTTSPISLSFSNTKECEHQSLLAPSVASTGS